MYRGEVGLAVKSYGLRARGEVGGLCGRVRLRVRRTSGLVFDLEVLAEGRNIPVEEYLEATPFIACCA